MTAIAAMTAMNARPPGNGVGLAVQPAADLSAFEEIFASIAAQSSSADPSLSTPPANDPGMQAQNAEPNFSVLDPLQAGALSIQPPAEQGPSASQADADSNSSSKNADSNSSSKPDIIKSSSSSEADAAQQGAASLSAQSIPSNVILPITPQLFVQASPPQPGDNQDDGPAQPASATNGQAGDVQLPASANAPNQIASGAAGFAVPEALPGPATASNAPARNAGALQNGANGRQASADAKSAKANTPDAHDALAQLAGTLAQKPGPDTFSPATLALSAPSGAQNGHAGNTNSGTGGHGHAAQDQSSGFGDQQAASGQPASAAPVAPSVANPAPPQTQPAPPATQTAAPSVTAAGPAPLMPATATANIALTPHTTGIHPGQTPDIGTLALTIAARSQAGTRQFDIRLDPPELGRVDVRLSVDDSGKAQATLAADRPETLHLLRNDAPALERALKDSGLDLANNGLSFSLKGQDRQADAGANQSRNRSFAAKAQLTIESVGQSTSTPISLAPNGAGLDIRV